MGQCQLQQTALLKYLSHIILVCTAFPHTKTGSFLLSTSELAVLLLASAVDIFSSYSKLTCIPLFY